MYYVIFLCAIEKLLAYVAYFFSKFLVQYHEQT